MSLSMYQASIPVFVRMLTSLSALLDKAQAHAEAKKYDSAVFMPMRLYPDMLPFSAQVQIACDAPKLFCARATGMAAPKYDDKEATLAELKERIAGTIAFLKTVQPEQLDGGEDKDITFQSRGRDRSLKGRDYLLHLATPNLYFHIATAYGILRKSGVEVGKMDFLGVA